MLATYIFIIVVSLTGIFGCTDVAGNYPDGCAEDPNIARIVCRGTEPCVCKDGNDHCTAIVPTNVLFNVTSADLDGEKCRQICKLSRESPGNASKCEYFRWEMV